jgi:Na+/H+-dicarboxylate symporter
MKRLFTWLLIGAMFAGIGVGYFVNQTMTPEQATEAAGWFNVLTDIFLRLIKMIIAPLVFSTLVVGIAHMEDAGAIGRVGAKTMGWFITASIISLTIGLVMVQLIQPGVGLGLPLPPLDADAGVAKTLSFKEFIAHVFPRSIIEAMATNEILQIVVFSIFVGTAIATIDDRAPMVLAFAEQVAQIMLKVTGFVMKLAPMAIFAALASTVATQGIEVIGVYAKFVGGFYLSLGILWAVLTLAAMAFMGAKRGLNLIGMVREPTLLAFSAASSEAAYPRTMEQLEKFGVSRRIVSFVLPLGYSFNLDGSMMYCTFAVLFIAQAYGIEITLVQQVIMLGLLMITSKGIAGVPRASLVVIAATLAYFDLPEAGLLLIIAVDHLLDMGRSATNVIGNSVAAAVVGKWEGELGKEGEPPVGGPPIAGPEAPLLPDQPPREGSVPSGN